MERYLYRLVGILIIGFAVYFVRIQIVEHMTDRQLERVARIQAEAQEKIRRKQLADERENNLRKEQERLEAKRQLEKARAEQAFNKAFTDWYKEPDSCDQWQSDRHMVDCVQHKMTAKSEFREIYKQK